MSAPNTLDEAQRELARQECAHRGHSWDVVETMAGPAAIHCLTCGTSHRVDREGS